MNDVFKPGDFVWWLNFACFLKNYTVFYDTLQAKMLSYEYRGKREIEEGRAKPEVPNFEVVRGMFCPLRDV